MEPTKEAKPKPNKPPPPAIPPILTNAIMEAELMHTGYKTSKSMDNMTEFDVRVILAANKIVNAMNPSLRGLF